MVKSGFHRSHLVVLHTLIEGVVQFGMTVGFSAHGSQPGYRKVSLKESSWHVLCGTHKQVQLQSDQSDNTAMVEILQTKTRRCSEIMHLLCCSLASMT